MEGIVDFGIHVPRYRLSAQCLNEAWSRPGGKGEKAVANFDEDSLTMGVNAALDCIKDKDLGKIEGLFFATNSSPYREKLSASVIATAIDLSPNIRTADYQGSLRAATSALLGAIDAVRSGACEKVLVVAADCRIAEPGSNMESLFGDGAVALLIGKKDVAAAIEASYSVADEVMDLWKREEDLYVRQDDVRFSQEYGYKRLVSESIKEILSSNRYKQESISKVVLPVVDARTHLALARKMGFDANEQLQDSFVKRIGVLGTAHSLLLLAAALERAKPKEKLLFAGYGDGSDAFILEVTDTIQKINCLRTEKALAARRELKNYTKYLSFRNLINGQNPLTEPFSSITMAYRERDQNLKLYARRCKKCNLVQFLRDIHVCPECYAHDEYEPIKLSKEGTLFTFNHEYYYPTPDPPTTMASVDFPEKARILMQMTDTPIDQVKFGMPVELTFRKYHDGNFFHNYFWKCRSKT